MAHTVPVVTQVAAHHLLARGAGHVPLDIVGEVIAEPVSEGTRATLPQEFRNEGVAGADRRR